jgi:hypothetical protein
MKKLILTILTVFVVGLAANAQTNTTVPTLATNAVEEASGKQAGSWEVTLGGGGTQINNDSTFGLDISVGTNPFKDRPEVWLGVVQGAYWEPTFAGSTDIYADWSQPILPEKLDDSLYLNAGWSVGALYDRHTSATWRTGPEASLQWYTSDNAFIYGGVNWDFVSQGDHGLRYSFGIGLAF